MYKSSLLVSIVFLAGLFSLSAQATVITLDSSNICSQANAGVNQNIAVGDVQGATNCFGVFGGNLNSNDQISYMGTVYDELSKIDGANAASGTDIGFSITGANSTSGNWSFDFGSIVGDYLILLKASDAFAVWSFEGGDAVANTGTWQVSLLNNGGQTADLSHISIYSSAETTSNSEVSTPYAITLFLVGMGLLLVRRIN